MPQETEENQETSVRMATLRIVSGSRDTPKIDDARLSLRQEPSVWGHLPYA